MLLDLHLSTLDFMQDMSKFVMVKQNIIFVLHFSQQNYISNLR